MEDTSCNMKDKEGAGNVNGDGAVPEEEYWVETAQNKRLYNGQVDYLLKQKRYSDKDSTWEPKVNQDFPDLIRECRLEKVEGKNCGSSSAMRSTGGNKETRKRKSNAESEEKKHSNKKKSTEEMTPVEIHFGPEVVTTDDNSDGDDVIFVGSVHSVHNLQEPLTKNQSCALCTLESRVIQHDVSLATATNHRDFGELRTIVKFLGENSGSSSRRADVMKGTIPDNGNSDVQRVTVHTAGTSEILKDSYTNASRKELPAQKWQVCSEGDVTECAPVQCVPLQKVLEEGLSALSAQPRPTNMQEKLEFKQQHSSTQLSKENINQQPSEQLLNMLKQRFYVLDPNSTFQQEEQQQEGLQLQQQLVREIPGIQHISMSLAQKGAELHKQRYSNAHWTAESVSGLVSQTASKPISRQELQKTSGLDSGPSQLLNAHTAPMLQQKQDVKNVASTQQQFSKIKLFHDTVYQQNRQQASQIHQESSGHYMSHHLSEQCVQLDVPQTVGCTSPQPNVQLAPCIFQEFPQYSNDQNMVRTIRSHNEHTRTKKTVCQPEQLSNESNSAQFMSQASLQRSGQHVISGVKDSRAQNVYHTMKQSIQQTASELPPPPNGECALQLPQCDRQSLACTQQQTSGPVSQPVQQRNGQCILQPLQQCVSQSSQQSGKQIVLQIPNQYSGQIVIQVSDQCYQNCTPQSVQECCESDLLELQQQQEETKSHIVHTGEAKKERQTESYQQRPGDSNLPRNPLVSSKTVQHLHMADEPSKTQSHIVSALGLKQCTQPQKQKQQQWQQRQYIPIRTPQEPQQHTLLAEYDMVLHQASSRSQARDPRNHLQPFEERIEQFLSNGVLLQNMSQPLQNLKNKKIKETELKLDPVISLCKSQLTNQEGNPHNYNHQIPTSQVVCHQSQQSVNLLTMIQQQQSSQEQNSKVTVNPDDRSVPDPTGGHAGKDVIPVGNVIIEESHLPPLGMLNHPPLAVGDSVYVMNGGRCPWVLATIQDIVSQNNQTFYTVELLNSKNKNTKKKVKQARSFQLAYTKVQDFRFSVGHRVISIFRDGISDEEYYSGVIAEPPKSINHYRYLIFFDNGHTQYVKHEDLRLVVDSTQSVWEDLHKESRDFVQNYLEKYPERALLKVQEGQYVSTEWNGSWYNAKVLKVDASLAQMSFPTKGKHVEWIYRGSTRFYPLFEANNRTCKKQFARSKAVSRNICDPYIQYTVKEEEELHKEIKEEHEATIEEFEPPCHSTTRISTISQSTTKYLHSTSTVKSPKRIYYPRYSELRFKPHKCKPSCLTAGGSEKDYDSYQNLLSHLSEPMLNGWTREKVKHSDNVSVYYRTPCKLRVRNIEELHKYLLKTESKLTVEQFDFHHWVRCFSEPVNEKYITKIEDISNGEEAVPVSCINTVDSRKPDKFTYVTKHVPANGTYIETDPEFLVCCDCIDDCLDKEKCACWRQTMAGIKYGRGNEPLSHKGYYYKRLYEQLITGIYECNSRCKCSSTCLNRLVQLPMKCKIQVFMTPDRGWGVRTLHDVPKGSYMCLYAGLVLPEAVGDAVAEEAGDEYQADLNYIEDAERLKEHYEENPYGNELEEQYGKKQNSKHRRQTATSRKLTGKKYKIVSPSTRFLFGRNGRFIVDAKTSGNVGRFINHSCNPNLFVQNVFVDTHDLRFPFVAFFTNSFVPAYTELTWNYGYDVGSVPDRMIICKCGETNCQGRLL